MPDLAQRVRAQIIKETAAKVAANTPYTMQGLRRGLGHDCRRRVAGRGDLGIALGGRAADPSRRGNAALHVVDAIWAVLPVDDLRRSTPRATAILQMSGRRDLAWR